MFSPNVWVPTDVTSQYETVLDIRLRKKSNLLRMLRLIFFFMFDFHVRTGGRKSVRRVVVDEAKKSIVFKNRLRLTFLIDRSYSVARSITVFWILSGRKILHSSPRRIKRYCTQHWDTSVDHWSDIRSFFFGLSTEYMFNRSLVVSRVDIVQTSFEYKSTWRSFASSICVTFVDLVLDVLHCEW